ncbi:MAG: endonuclease/exonuclease/phosphatase family protein [Pseudomonadota bacterium]
MLRDIARGEDPQVGAVIEVIHAVAPDILVIGGFDWDFENRAVAAFQKELATAGHAMPYAYAPQPNRGLPTGLDLDQDGRLNEPEDRQGFARFTGADGLALLSRFPVQTEDAIDLTPLLWSDLPGALLPYPNQPEGLGAAMRLSTTGHWVVPVQVPDQPIVWIGSFHATPPVFDGPEDRNGRRNHDEVAIWSQLLGDLLDTKIPSGFLLAANSNLDPNAGDGRRRAMANLLADPRLIDPLQSSSYGLVTVDWQRDDLDPMRISYVLPDTSFKVLDAGVFWPAIDEDMAATVATASRHRLVWVDVVRRR